MQEKDLNAKINEAIDQHASFVREGQEFYHGATDNSDPSVEDPIAEAKATQLVQTDGQSALMPGDIAFVPEGTDFDKAFIGAKFSAGQQNTTFGLMLPVIRAGKLIVLRVFVSTFTRGVRILDNRGNEAKDFSYPEGTACTAVRNNVGSVYDALHVLAGKAIKVVAKTRVKCMVIKRGSARDPETNRFPTEPGNQNMYKIDFVDKKTWTDALAKA